MTLHRRVSGQWQEATNLYVKRNGTWQAASKLYVKRNGTWVRAWPDAVTATIDSFETWPGSWSEPSNQVRDITQSTAQVLDGTYSITHPAGSGADEFWSLPGDGLGAYPGPGSRHRVYYRLAGTDVSTYWRWMMNDARDSYLYVRIWPGNTRIDLFQSVSGTATRLDVDREVDWPTNTWLELDIKTEDASGGTFGLGGDTAEVTLSNYNQTQDSRTQITRLNGQFDSAVRTRLDGGQGGLGIAAGDGGSQYWLDHAITVPPE